MNSTTLTQTRRYAQLGRTVTSPTRNLEIYTPVDSKPYTVRRRDWQGNLIKQVDIGSLGHYTFKPTQTRFSYGISKRKQLHQDIIANKLYIEAYLKEEACLLGWELGTIAPASLRLQILEANPIIYQKSTATLESEDR